LVDNSSESLQEYRNIFNELDEDWDAIVNARDTERETRFIQDVLSKKGTVLDLCCGTGRHSIVMRKHGWSMGGLDLSRNLLAIAKQRMKKEGVEFPLVRADMRFFPFRNQVFDFVICMFTSFGYLPSEREDLKSFREVRRTLREGGRFLLDVINIDHVARVFHEREWGEFEPFYMLEKRSLDLQRSMLLSQWTIIRKDTKEVRHVQHNLRLYGFKRLKKMLGETGLMVEQVYGGYDKKAFSQDASRMIILAQKAES
jgi:ubiquinone/menaquinone biosynthesis C-methylase UbiE